MLEAFDEVIGMNLANNFDTKVVNDTIESGGMGDVTKKTWSVTGGDVPIVSKVFDEFYVC